MRFYLIVFKCNLNLKTKVHLSLNKLKTTLFFFRAIYIYADDEISRSHSKRLGG